MAYYYQRPPSTVPAYVTAGLFIACSLLSFVLAALGWNGIDNPHAIAAVIGMLYSGKVTGNVDFGISMTMTVACTTITFALILLARLSFARWFLAALGGLVSAYYASAVVYIVVHGAISYVALPLLALMLWAAATAMALLPLTMRAMRRRRPIQARR